MDQVDQRDLRAFGANPSLPGMPDPYPVYAALREQAPAHWCDGPQMWAVLAYPEACHLLRDPALVRQPERDRLAQMYGNSDIYTKQKLDLPYMDGDSHRSMRHHVLAAYHAIDLADLTGFISSFASARLAGVADRDRFDLVAVLADDLPVYVVSHLLGVPAGELESAAAAVRPFVAARGLVQDGPIAADADDAVKAFEDFFLPLINARRAYPTGDLISRLISDPAGGLRLSDEQMLMLVSSNFYAASLFTVRLLIGTVAVALARYPDIYRALRRNRSLIPSVVEEVLRWDAPAQAVNSSIAERDVECGSVTIPAGDSVTVLVGAANRDPTQFAEPDVVRLDRRPNRHLSFAPGVHQCLGLNLARLQATLALESLADRIPAFGYDPDASVRLVADRFRGYEALVVVT